MPRSLTLTIPAPCHESWAAMTPAAQGRHCTACAKTVVDFSCMTDVEVLAMLRRPAGTCGRFRADQLHRPLVAATGTSRWRGWLAAAVALLGLRELVAQPAKGQSASVTTTSIERVSRKPRDNRPEPSAATAAPDSLVVRGRVVDKASGEGLPGVTVLVAETTIGVSTSTDGTFALNIPDSSFKNRVLSFSSIGYVPEEKPALFFDSSDAVMALSVDVKGEIGGCAIPPPWHPRAFWFWLTRPFRR